MKWWPPSGGWSGKHWYGPAQEEDRSPENIRACYRFLRSVPYQSAEDLARLAELENIAVTEALMTNDAEQRS